MTPSTQDARATGLVELTERVEAASFDELGRVMLLEIFNTAKPRSTFANGRDSDRARHAFVSLWEAGGTINAAMTLVPDDMAFVLDWLRYEGKGDRPVYWEAFVQFIDDAVNRGNSEAATPALALTAAALRARALAASTKDMNHDG